MVIVLPEETEFDSPLNPPRFGGRIEFTTFDPEMVLAFWLEPGPSQQQEKIKEAASRHDLEVDAGVTAFGWRSPPHSLDMINQKLDKTWERLNFVEPHRYVVLEEWELSTDILEVL